MANPMKILFIERFRWKRFATIHVANDFFSSIVKGFIELSGNLTLVTSEIVQPGESAKVALENIKSRDARIIFATMYEDQFTPVFCEAHRMGLTGPRFLVYWDRRSPYMKILCFY